MSQYLGEGGGGLDERDRNASLQRELVEVNHLEKLQQTESFSSEEKLATLRRELLHVRTSVESAKKLRKACDRLSCVDGKLHKAPHTRQYQMSLNPCAAVPLVRKQTAALVVAGVITLGFAFLLSGGSKHICRARPAARWEDGKWQGAADEMFNPNRPPLMIDGSPDVTRSHAVLWGQASLKVCSRGTSEKTFWRREDCDGCLCPVGSVWFHYADPRFYGNGEFCVPESEWKDCINHWSCCAHKPNHCWDFIFDGARRDPERPDNHRVLVDSCTTHHACFALIRRHRRWELVQDEHPPVDRAISHHRRVGVPENQVENVNATMKMKYGQRGWGLPSSILHLIKVDHTSAPEEWRSATDVEQSLVLKGGYRNKIWQLVSDYQIIAKDKSGMEHVMAAWEQREFNAYHDIY